MMAIPPVRNDSIIEDDDYAYRLQADLLVTPEGQPTQHFSLSRLCERSAVEVARAFLIEAMYLSLREKNLIFGSKIGHLTISQERIHREAFKYSPME